MPALWLSIPTVGSLELADPHTARGHVALDVSDFEALASRSELPWAATQAPPTSTSDINNPQPHEHGRGGQLYPSDNHTYLTQRTSLLALTGTTRTSPDAAG